MTNQSIATRDTQQTAIVVLQTLQQLVMETGHRLIQPLDLDSRLDRDGGLDSLGRAELLSRIEVALQVRLPETALSAETPRDLLRLIMAASGASPRHTEILTRPTPEAATAVPNQASTLTEVLEWQVQQQPQRLIMELYGDGDQISEQFSYETLWQGALRVAGGLRERGLESSQRVAIMLPTSAGYFLSFLGILLAGGVPVPIYPPVRPSQVEEHLRRHVRLLENAQAKLLITVPEARTVGLFLRAQVTSLDAVVVVEELLPTASVLPPPAPVRGGDMAFLQYTSGSTSDPKGVVITHANVLANLRAMGERVKTISTDVFVSWLPLYHDMGLIGAWLSSLYFGYPLVVMSPLHFLARPSRWLWAIHRHRGSLSAAPNFAYQRCLNIDTEELQGLDLSSWRMAFNGAEPVSVETMEAFRERFTGYGLRPEALAPVYGLAEASLGLSLHPPDRGLVVDRIQRQAFMVSGQATPATPEDDQILRFASCGQVLSGHQIRIVDERGRTLPERREGRLEFRGPSTTSGYFRNPEATRNLFRGDGDWLDSGDRAYLAGDDVYITGRVKDIIIRGGRNFYPYELEQAVGELPGIRKGCVAVFTSRGAAGEQLIVVAETRETDPQQRQQLHRAIQRASAKLLGLPPDQVVLAKPHTVLKTSSGKIRRAALRSLHEQGRLNRASQSVVWQLLRLAMVSFVPYLWRQLKHLGAIGYAGYTWLLFYGIAPLALLAVMVLPHLTWRWTATRMAVRVLGGLAGIPLQAQGLENLPQGACVLVANHTSYLDAFVLVASIPKNFSYVAKRELADNIWVRLGLQRVGTLFVERFDLQRSAEEGKRVAEAVVTGQSLAFFPEGAISHRIGLLPFRMGAFVAAAQGRVPVVPVIIRGTRSILPGGTWFPRRGKVRVMVTEALYPSGEDWTAALALKDKAREVILRHTGEPDLRDEQVMG